MYQLFQEAYRVRHVKQGQEEVTNEEAKYIIDPMCDQISDLESQLREKDAEFREYKGYLDDVARAVCKKPKDHHGWTYVPCTLPGEIQRLHAVIERLRADKERLDWLESHPFMAYRDRDPETLKMYNHFTLVNEDKKPRVGIVLNTLREAIDAARSTPTEINLSKRDHECLLESLENPPQPSEALRRAAAKHLPTGERKL